VPAVHLKPSEIVSKLQSSYWFVPAVITLCGPLLALGLLYVDARMDLDPAGAFWLIYPRSPEGARSFLSAMTGAMITATSVTFSVTIVALTVAAQHFGPRVLNNFIRHTSAQAVLGTFIATFVYAVLALGAVHSGDESSIPQLTVLGAVGLVLISVGALIYYVQHVASALQVGHIAAEIAADVTATIGRLYRERPAEDAGHDSPSAAPPDAAPVASKQAGYLQRIDYDALSRAAEARRTTRWVAKRPGAFVVPGAVIAHAHPAVDDPDGLAAAVDRACVVGRDRTIWQDALFGIAQLVEVALRALSPGVNEPFTAITCIDRLTEVLGCAAAADRPQTEWRAGGRVTVVARFAEFPELLEHAFTPIRVFAGPNPDIAARLLDAIATLIPLTRRAQDRDALDRQADLIARAALDALRAAEDQSDLAERYERVKRM
jgi:uncharacterized membrane protein